MTPVPAAVQDFLKRESKRAARIWKHQCTTALIGDQISAVIQTKGGNARIVELTTQSSNKTRCVTVSPVQRL
jgi:hypothetical protein